MFGIYTLSEIDSTHWVLVSTADNQQSAEREVDDFHTASGDFCTRALEGSNEVIIPREQVKIMSGWQ